MRTLEKIEQIHQAVWQKGYGAISAKEAYFLQEMIGAKKPKRFLELGTASGLSTGFIAEFMSRNNGRSLVSIDVAKAFWIDPDKRLGFLARQIYRGNDIDIVFQHGRDSSYVAETHHNDPFDMAFIDADHQHPWPTLDMIAILPALKKLGRIIVHDLALYKRQVRVRSMGPKYLFDQIQPELRVVTNDAKKNIFYIQTTENFLDFRQALVDSLLIPWTNRIPIAEKTLTRFGGIIERHWDQHLLKAFEAAARKFNHHNNKLKIKYILAKRKFFEMLRG